MALLALAIAPCLAIMLLIYLRDKHEREPLKLLILSFGLGILSVLITYILSNIASKYAPKFNSILLDEAVHAFLTVAFIEEISKFLFLMIFLFPKRDFNEPFDGIVYTVMIGMGFATFENILYTMEGGLSTGILRMFTAVPGHAVFAILMGYFVGKAKFSSKKILYSCLGLFTATFFHGIYDYFLFISHIPGIVTGSIIALVFGIYLSVISINQHSNASPFREN